MGNKKERIDKLLVDRCFFETREKARAAIMCGIVYVDEQRIDKPGQNVSISSNIIIKSNTMPYVSRGGLKLKKAIDSFDITVKGKIALDVGASTGGFTHCLLEHGAKKVYAVDVGYGQLSWKLRNDSRVVCMERTNVRHLAPRQIPDVIDIVTIDASFISLKLIIEPIKLILKYNGEIVCLVKPQFEAGREKVGKKGVIKDVITHTEVLENMIDYVLKSGLTVLGITYSPIKGAEGNIEYLLYLKKDFSDLNVADFKIIIEEVVKESHEM